MAKKLEEPKKSAIPNYAKFIINGMAGCAAVVFCQPIDVVKNRMQLSGEGGKAREHRTALHAGVEVVKKYGFIALYDGFSANIARQIAYTMTRLGIFQIAVDKLAEHEIKGFTAQVTSGLAAGFIASLVATPTDVAHGMLMLGSASNRAIIPSESLMSGHPALEVPWKVPVSSFISILGLQGIAIEKSIAKHHVGIFCVGVALVRMTSDRRLPDSEQRKYKNVIDAIIRMGREEGVPALWAGVTPTVLRAMLGTVTQLVTYVQAKQYLLRNKYTDDNLICHFTSSLISGLVYAFSTAPLDMAKTRLQNMKIINGKAEYNNLLEVWARTLKNEGVTALWKGFGPYYFRIAPNTVLLFIFSEKFTFWYKKYILKDTSAKGGF